MRSKTKTKLDKQNKKQKYYPQTNNQTSPSGREKEKHESKPKQQRSQQKETPAINDSMANHHSSSTARLTFDTACSTSL